MLANLLSYIRLKMRNSKSELIILKKAQAN